MINDFELRASNNTALEHRTHCPSTSSELPVGDRENVEYDESSGRLQTSHTNENIKKVSAEVRKNRHQTVAQKGKVTLGVFFDIQGIVHLEFIPEEHYVKKELSVDILRRLRESAETRLKLWAEQSWVNLHIPTYLSLLVTDFLAQTKTTVLPHPSYTPFLAPCDFILLPEVAHRFLGRRFQSADEVKSAARAGLKDMSKNGFHKCFDYLYKRLQKCRVA
ncbi:putative mariner transposase [Trichonephila clavipes]|nr:putative mariner transposase [Trichonephila clavipes]